jgi:hypothetical protein
MNEKPFGHLTVEADKVALKRGAVYHGGLLLASGVGAATVAVYDGLDTSGTLIDRFAAATSSADRHVFERGIDLRVGLYVDLGDNVSKFTVYYEPPAAPER